MENASNALLISGGILIAMLIIAMGVIIFSNYSEIGQTYDQTLQATEVQKFNANFLKFEGKTNITIQEIVTLANFVKQYNEKAGTNVEVLIVGVGSILKKDGTALIKDNLDKKFKCISNNIKYFDDGNEKGMIRSIQFSEN